MDLRVKRLSPDAKLPTRAHEGDAGLDLYAVKDELFIAGYYFHLDFGIAVEIPVGFVGKLHIRSGLAKKGFSLLQGVGVIDSGYRGSIGATIRYDGETECEECHIEAGDRVCQLLIEPVEMPDVIEVDELSESERGVGGFGSSGK